MMASRFNDPGELRRKIRHVNHALVDGNLFIEVLLTGIRLRSAAELSRLIDVAPAVISRTRSGRAPVSDDMLLKLHIACDLAISGLKDLLDACTRSDQPITTQRIDELAAFPVFDNCSCHQLLPRGAHPSGQRQATLQH